MLSLHPLHILFLVYPTCPKPRYNPKTSKSVCSVFLYESRMYSNLKVGIAYYELVSEFLFLTPRELVRCVIELTGEVVILCGSEAGDSGCEADKIDRNGEV